MLTLNKNSRAGGLNLVNYDGLYNKDYFGDKLKNENHFSAKKLHFKIIENATILPHKGLPDSLGFGGIVDSNGNYILIDSGHSKYSSTFRPAVTGRQIILGNLCGRELCK